MSEMQSLQEQIYDLNNRISKLETVIQTLIQSVIKIHHNGKDIIDIQLEDTLRELKEF